MGAEEARRSRDHHSHGGLEAPSAQYRQPRGRIPAQGYALDLESAATNDVETLLALDADCVCYTAQGESRIRETSGDLTRILESGKNVVNTSIVALVYPNSAPRLREALEKACSTGGVTFLTSGG